ncbi:heme-binding protein [Actinoplanes sp. NPDC049599]|uniref:heme-binding protein n=1 Tax=Actinoplanes sp. NPDC049599 TaxID=3363903 RepID=UPI0037B01785
MTETANVARLRSEGRHLEPARTGDPDLGPFQLLPGTWANKPNLPGRGWNMIALPFVQPAGSTFPPPYRLLLNQFNEELKFQLVDKAVPNRGLDLATPANTDQVIVTLDYEQSIAQIAAEDFPLSGLAGAPDLAIHHEPGLLLNMTNEVGAGPDIARLATIPHGDAALALGNARLETGMPAVPVVNALPIGVNQDIEANRYLLPYKHFHDNLFRNLFDPTDPTALLTVANQGVDIVRTTVLEFDTTVESGGINNIPFVVRQANASEMKATFFIQELAETDEQGRPKLRLQYVQVVQLDFFPRLDGGPGRIKWPHVSINTLEKVTEEVNTESYAAMPS